MGHNREITSLAWSLWPHCNIVPSFCCQRPETWLFLRRFLCCLSQLHAWPVQQYGVWRVLFVWERQPWVCFGIVQSAASETCAVLGKLQVNRSRGLLCDLPWGCGVAVSSNTQLQDKVVPCYPETKTVCPALSSPAAENWGPLGACCLLSGEVMSQSISHP